MDAGVMGWGWVTIKGEHEGVFEVMILFCILIVVMGTQTIHVLNSQNCIPKLKSQFFCIILKINFLKIIFKA